MEAADYTELLKQAEEELGKTPGAYCSRKVAIRAMELLQAYVQQQVDEMSKAAAQNAVVMVRQLSEQNATIERQAAAIKRLESEKTIRIGSQSKPNPYSLDPNEPDIGMMEKLRRLDLQRQEERRRMKAEQRNRFHLHRPSSDFLNHFLDTTGPGWKDPLT